MNEDLIDWTLAGNAFGIGVFSALSPILGAIAARFWIPEDRTVAALMAFGGGAIQLLDPVRIHRSPVFQDARDGVLTPGGLSRRESRRPTIQAPARISSDKR
ncbi:MAG: hypothetical protein LJE91_10135 [Gammaproteobacteria bacterium]|jgi:hypothetical protein|nr:hypothetical protein [Gammaproteobacteria bacterium]